MPDPTTTTDQQQPQAGEQCDCGSGCGKPEVCLACPECAKRMRDEQHSGIPWQIGLSGPLDWECCVKINELEATVARQAEQIERLQRPIPMELQCPYFTCRMPHVDKGEWATRPHKTHRCTYCGHDWRPANVPTVGVESLAALETDR